MAADAHDCATVRLNVEALVTSHQGRRILPEDPVPAQAWTENEEERHPETNSPGENRRLLPPTVSKKSRLQAGVTLGVDAHAKYTKCPQFKKPQKKTANAKFQKKIEKLKVVLKPPYFILTIIILIVIIYQVDVTVENNLRDYLEWYSEYWWREPWRLFTYGFVHANGLHLALNALMTVAVGWILEHEQGWWRVVVVWCGGVAAGALGAGALQPRVKVIGASAAVYALLTSHIANVCLRYGHIPLWWFRPLSVVVLAMSEGCWALLKTSPAWQSATAAQAQPASYAHVAWAAHALGAAVGVPLAFIVFTGENINKRHVIASRVLSAILLVAGVAMATVYYACWADTDNT